MLRSIEAGARAADKGTRKFSAGLYGLEHLPGFRERAARIDSHDPVLVADVRIKQIAGFHATRCKYLTIGKQGLRCHAFAFSDECVAIILVRGNALQYHHIE